ncbi:MAG: ADP-forming succinate--CoA ligase subunit beta [Gammaproteobacteria bacterium]|nr:MAG: ADP-forming succinate--CoA ligase subunit beta [Gammaproteobacteria bacterium]
MNIHEYQTKELLKSYGVPVPAGRVAHTISHAGSVADEIGGSRWVVKAQIHAGGRGKGGGVKIAGSIEEVQKLSDQMIGSRLVTNQTDNNGYLVQRVLVEQALNINKEFYLGLVINRASQRITLIASSSGGMDIEQVANETPEKVIKEIIDPAVGLHEFQCRKVCARIGLVGKQMQAGVKLMKRLYRCFRDKDALLTEINPLALVEGDELVALDAKMSFDDNALFRHPDITDLRDFDEEDSKEIDASGHGLNYIALDGNVGCIVNGAGLAMATMDSIALHGGCPANFLDVGGGASPEKIANAFRIVLEDPNVKGILLNIFAGINRCDWIAKGIVQAIRDQEIKVPVVVRLAGTNVEQGWIILEESGLEYIKAAKLDTAAKKIIEVINEKKQ